MGECGCNSTTVCNFHRGEEEDILLDALQETILHDATGEEAASLLEALHEVRKRII